MLFKLTLNISQINLVMLTLSVEVITDIKYNRY